MDDTPSPLDIPPDDWAATPVSVQSVVLALVSLAATYEQQLIVLQDQLVEQQDKLAQLQARLNQHSQNSSKPPSSDPPSAPPRPAKTPRGRARGAQDGHERHQRPRPEAAQINEHCNNYPDTCPSCHDDIACNHHEAS